jgi:hypothetical protein
MTKLLPLVLLAALSAPATTLRYWIEPCTQPESGCRANDTELAEWAMAAWQGASDGHLKLEKTTDRERAHIRLHWVTGQSGLYGETRPIEVMGVRGAEVYVLPTVVPPNADGLLRDAVVYLTCLHETGHALGLAHTAEFADIMYSFQYGGDIAEYFARYRREIHGRTEIREHSGISPADRKRLLEVYR